MIKNTVIALVAAVSLAGVAAPAFADTSAFGDVTPDMREFLQNSVETQLQQKGINVSGVEDYNGLIRAFVTLEDGTQTMQFYTPGSLEQVTF